MSGGPRAGRASPQASPRVRHHSKYDMGYRVRRPYSSMETAIRVSDPWRMGFPVSLGRSRYCSPSLPKTSLSLSLSLIFITRVAPPHARLGVTTHNSQHSLSLLFSLSLSLSLRTPRETLPISYIEYAYLSHVSRAHTVTPPQPFTYTREGETPPERHRLHETPCSESANVVFLKGKANGA